MRDTFHANIEQADPIGALTRNIAPIHIPENDRDLPGRGNTRWGQTFATIMASGYDSGLTFEPFGRGLPNLAAATKAWRDFAENPRAMYRGGYAHIRAGLA